MKAEEIKPLFDLTDKQAEFIADGSDEVLYGGSAGGGKTYALSIKALGLNNIGIAHPEYRSLIIRKSFEDLDTVLKFQSRIYRETTRPQAEWKEQKKEWVWPNGATVAMGYLSTKSDLDRYTGNEYSFIGVEELPDTIPELSWWQLLVSRTRTDIDGLHPQTVATANPKGRGFAWMQAHWAVAPDGKSTFQETWTDRLEIGGIVIEPRRTTRRYIQSLITDNTLWPVEQRAAYMAKLAQMNENDRNALLFGRWDYAAADDLLIHPALVAKAYDQILIPERLKVGRRIIGCDPAHQGKDTTVLIHRKLQTAFRLQRWARLDSMQLVHKLKMEIDRASDEDGVPPLVNLDYAHGTGPIERLRELGYQANLIHFNGKPHDPVKYRNKRAEMYGEMAEAMAEADHYRIPPDPALKAQLSAIMIERDSDGRLKLAAKDEIKKAVGRSPDEADALALTYAWPYVPTVAQMAGSAGGHVVERW
jgi:hypothetical protein